MTSLMLLVMFWVATKTCTIVICREVKFSYVLSKIS